MAQTVENEKQMAIREEHMAAEQLRSQYGTQVRTLPLFIVSKLGSNS